MLGRLIVKVDVEVLAGGVVGKLSAKLLSGREVFAETLRSTTHAYVVKAEIRKVCVCSEQGYVTRLADCHSSCKQDLMRLSLTLTYFPSASNSRI